MIVKFINVGREKKTWEAEIDPLFFERDAIKSIRQNNALMSRNISFAEDEDNFRFDYIFAGMRTVGEFQVVGN